MVAALVTAGVGVVLLVALVTAVTAPVRRFTRASAALRTDVARRLASLRALWRVRGSATTDDQRDRPRPA